MLGNEREFWGAESSGREPIRDRAPAVSCCHGQNPILGRGLIGNWIFRGIGSGRGLLIGNWIFRGIGSGRGLSDMKYPSWRERGMNTKGLLKMNEEDKCIACPKQSFFAYQYLTSLFDSTVTASKDFTAEIRADAASSCYTFMDKLNNTPLITYWLSAHPPDNGTTMDRAEIKLKGIRLQSPVLVDIRTGTVYQIPKPAMKRTNTLLEFTLPIYDSPLLLCDASFLHSRKVLRSQF